MQKYQTRAVLLILQLETNPTVIKPSEAVPRPQVPLKISVFSPDKENVLYLLKFDHHYHLRYPKDQYFALLLFQFWQYHLLFINKFWCNSFGPHLLVQFVTIDISFLIHYITIRLHYWKQVSRSFRFFNKITINLDAKFQIKKEQNLNR